MKMRRTFFTLLLMLGTLAGFVQGATMASFTDSAASSSNTFSTGVVDMATSPERTVSGLTFTNMVPGDKVTALLIVTNSRDTNNGGVSLSYNLSTSVTSDTGLGAGLKLQIRDNGPSCNNPQFASGGTQFFYGSSGPATLTGNNLFSSDLSLTAGSTQNLCFQVSLPTSPDPSGYADEHTTMVLTLTAHG